MKYTEINIKEGMPAAAVAMDRLKRSLGDLKRQKYECVLIIHGYGSTGRGGTICEKARQWLKAQEKSGKIRTVIFGEDFSIFNFKALELKNQCPQLAPLLSVCNNGVTVIEL